jgi:hypothetical protein
MKVVIIAILFCSVFGELADMIKSFTDSFDDAAAAPKVHWPNNFNITFGTQINLFKAKINILVNGDENRLKMGIGYDFMGSKSELLSTIVHPGDNEVSIKISDECKDSKGSLPAYFTSINIALGVGWSLGTKYVGKQDEYEIFVTKKGNLTMLFKQETDGLTLSKLVISSPSMGTYYLESEAPL